MLWPAKVSLLWFNPLSPQKEKIIPNNFIANIIMNTWRVVNKSTYLYAPYSELWALVALESWHTVERSRSQTEWVIRHYEWRMQKTELLKLRGRSHLERVHELNGGAIGQYSPYVQLQPNAAVWIELVREGPMGLLSTDYSPPMLFSRHTHTPTHTLCLSSELFSVVIQRMDG